MAKKRTSKRSSRKRKSNNSAIVVIMVVVIIALLSFFITYFIINDAQSAKVVKSSTVENITETVVEKTEVKPETGDSEVLTAIDGTWVSNNDGAMLTIHGKNFTIELPSVDSPQKTKGTIIYNDNNVTFLYSSAKTECGIKPGEYKYEINDDEIFFNVVNDDCKLRAKQLECGWFRL